MKSLTQKARVRSLARLQPTGIPRPNYSRLSPQARANALAVRGEQLADKAQCVPPTKPDWRSLDVYDGADLRNYTARPGALDAKHLPSRFGNTLHWPDGRITSASEPTTNQHHHHD